MTVTHESLRGSRGRIDGCLDHVWGRLDGPAS